MGFSKKITLFVSDEEYPLLTSKDSENEEFILSSIDQSFYVDVKPLSDKKIHDQLIDEAWNSWHREVIYNVCNAGHTDIEAEKPFEYVIALTQKGLSAGEIHKLIPIPPDRLNEESWWGEIKVFGLEEFLKLWEDKLQNSAGSEIIFKENVVICVKKEELFFNKKRRDHYLSAKSALTDLYNDNI